MVTKNIEFICESNVLRKQKHNYKPFYSQEKHSQISGEPHVLTRP